MASSLGKYRLTGVLGRGGMGEVFEAEDTLLRRKVAVKLLTAEVADDPQALERFLREARAAARLQHPHVVAIHEIDRRDGRWFIVLELVAGGSLQDRIKAGGPLPWQTATQYIADACRGLAAAHAAGLVHRDIKPANLMLTADGRVKVADFGLAKAAEDAGGLTAAGVVVGTPYFMSPEQWRSEPLNDLTDIYSIGATYYTLLTGHPPYAGKEPMQVMYAVCSGGTLDPSAERADVPEACAAVVKRAVAMDPARRYSSAAEMADDLEMLLPGKDSVRTKRGAVTVHSSDTAALRTAGGLPAASITIPIPPWSRRTWLYAAGGVIVAGFATTAAFALRPTGWSPLFNGRTADGWYLQGSGRVEVQNGVLEVIGDNTYLYTKREDFTDFHCRAEVKVNQAGDAGIFFRCKKADSLPFGYEANISPAGFGELHRELPHTPDPLTLKSSNRSISVDTWVGIEIIARGRRVEVLVDGQPLSWAEEPESDAVPRRGAFALQAFNPDTRLSVRKLEWRPLP